jgi:hypothetical protein
LVTACVVPAGARAAVVPVPTVTGPLPVSEASHPFGGAMYQWVPEDLSKDGYVEEEYFVSGLANVYDWPSPGPATIRTADAPYTTRILVRRPADPARSSGNAVVEMLNPSNNVDINIGWAIMRKQFERTGDTWVGITSRPITVAALKSFNPTRYAAVSFADPLPPAQRPCTVTGVEANQERGLVWDMNSQVAAWLRSNAASNPLRGVITHVFGFGYSQTGGFLNTYVNAIHKLASQANGKPMYDGYFITVAAPGFVGVVPINACSGNIGATDPRQVTGNQGVPIIRAMSNSDYISGIRGRRADSDDPADPYRHYEISGMGHASPFVLYYSARPADMVAAGIPVPAFSCNEGPRSRFPTNVAFDAIMQNLETWSRTGVAPPRSSFIQVNASNQPILDQFGNVQGGYRTPYLDVPTSTWYGNATGASFCFIAGYERPFSAEKLAQLYPTKADYVAKVDASVNSFVAQRFITEADGRYIRQEARYACKLGPANDPFAPSCWTDTDGGVGGSVPATLALTLGTAPTFGAFTPGVAKTYTASTTANVISTAGDATLSVSDPSATAPGKLVNGSFSLASPVMVKAGSGAFTAAPGTLRTYAAPVSNDAVTLAFEQAIGANEALRTGTYSKTLSFTLSTTTP